MRMCIRKKSMCFFMVLLLISMIPVADISAQTQEDEYYYEEIDPELEIEYAEDEISLFQAGRAIQIRWSVGNKKEKRSNRKMSLKKGQSVKVNAEFSNTKNVKVGIVDSNNKYTLKAAKDDVTLAAPKKGTYMFVVQNKSGKKIIVTGSYSY